MKSQIISLLERIRGVKSVQPFWAEIDAWAEAGWFAHGAWDVGIVCLRPGGTALSLLAATDTD